MHRLTLCHADLKPANVLLESPPCAERDPRPGSRGNYRLPSSRQLRIIDFGLATFHDSHHQSLVCTRPYRAPEVVLGLGWSYSLDIWSVGCIFMELLTGEALFKAREDLEHLARI